MKSTFDSPSSQTNFKDTSTDRGEMRKLSIKRMRTITTALHDKKSEYKEFFRIIDGKQRGFITYEQILETFATDKNHFADFDYPWVKQYLERYYKETKITEGGFRRLFHDLIDHHSSLGAAEGKPQL